MHRKAICLTIMVFVLVGLPTSVLAIPPPPISEEVHGHNYAGEVSGGQLLQLRFQQRTRFEFRANVSVNIDLACDAENVGFHQLRMEYQADENVNLQVRINATMLNLPMDSVLQNRVRLANGSAYEYRHRFVMNLSRDTTDPMNTTLRLRLTAMDGSIWAWINETTNEVIPLQSWQDGDELVASTDHYSTFVVITPTETLDPIIMILVLASVITAVVIIMWITKMRKIQKSSTLVDQIPQQNTPTSNVECPNGQNPDGTCM